MAGMGDVVRRLDYQKRARHTLGLKKSGSTKIQECSTFVRSANERHLDALKDAMRKMEADERQFRGVHDKQMNTVKRFHNTVHVKSTDFNAVNFNTTPSTSVSRSSSSSSLFGKDAQADATSRRRGSVPITSPLSNQIEAKRRHSVQADTSKYGRSFRMLKDAFIPKTKVSPESAAAAVGSPRTVRKTANAPAVTASGAGSTKTR